MITKHSAYFSIMLPITFKCFGHYNFLYDIIFIFCMNHFEY